MWQCGNCDEEVEDDLVVCWNCQAEREDSRAREHFDKRERRFRVFEALMLLAAQQPIFPVVCGIAMIVFVLLASYLFATAHEPITSYYSGPICLGPGPDPNAKLYVKGGEVSVVRIMSSAVCMILAWVSSRGLFPRHLDQR